MDQRGEKVAEWAETGCMEEWEDVGCIPFDVTIFPVYSYSFIIPSACACPLVYIGGGKEGESHVFDMHQDGY